MRWAGEGASSCDGARGRPGPPVATATDAVPILVVDDDANFGAAVARVLAATPFRPVAVRSGVDALRFLATAPPFDDAPRPAFVVLGGTRRSNAQSSHRTRRKPWTRRPHRRKARNSRSMKRGSPTRVGARGGRGEEGLQMLLHHPVQDRVGGGARDVGSHGAGSSGFRAVPPATPQDVRRRTQGAPHV